MSEFSDRPFVAGSLVGLRTFRVDPLGRLTGVTHKDVWTPGENEAVCHRRVESDAYMRQIIAYGGDPSQTYRSGRFSIGGAAFYPNITWAGDVLLDEERRRKEEAQHSLASVQCKCGFYAYFDGANDYLGQQSSASYATGGFVVGNYDEPDRAARIAAIVEGYGVCTVGSRGFRASKARILAVITPQGDTAKQAVAFSKVLRNYPDARVFDTEREAVAALPLTDPFDASPSDDDFWTRSAS